MEKDAPVYTAEPVECPHCQNIAPMRVLGSGQDLERQESDSGDSMESGTVYQIEACLKCKDVTVRSGFWHSGMDGEPWAPSEVLYPNRKKRALSFLPPAIRQEYEAAQKVASISANAYAVLLGRVLDVVMEDQGAQGATLFERLKDLAVKDVIPKTLGDMAHQLRTMRNFGAHANLGSLSPDEIPVLESVCLAVLEYVYKAPKLMATAQKAIDKLKQAQSTKPGGPQT